MAKYRLFCLDFEGQIHLAEFLEAADDQEAIRRAHDLKINSMKCEIWQGQRLVATLNADDLKNQAATFA
jgi:hypothetical protein